MPRRGPRRRGIHRLHRVGLAPGVAGLPSTDRLPAGAAPFKDGSALIEAAWGMFLARQSLAQASREASEDRSMGHEDAPSPAEQRRFLSELRARSVAWTSQFHQSVALTEDGVALCRLFLDHKLTPLEREILLVLLLDRLALVDCQNRCVSDVLGVLCLPQKRALVALRAMSERGRLFGRSLIGFDDADLDLRDRELVLDPELVDTVLHGTRGARAGFNARDPEDLYDRLSALTRALGSRGEQVDRIARGYGDRAAFFKQDRRMYNLLTRFRTSCARRTDWPLSRLFSHTLLGANWAARLVILALLGKERGHLPSDSDLFRGSGLAMACCMEPEEVEPTLRELGPGGFLAERGLIQPCGGFDALVSDHPSELAAAEFELSDKCLGLLGLDRSLPTRHGDGPEVRPPVVRLEQLVLADEAKSALAMAVAQAKHARVLIDDWGLGDVIHYGRSTTLLFSGPPGVGKTACAEALAHELGRPILVADFSRIQNCYVGMTEKNIVRTFRAARAAGAVLFWDEADAMFYQRDMASVTWEVRNVNVLLTEIERFEGVCILATNRKDALDPALDRRIAMKIRFEAPDRKMRRAIWQKLLPKSLPLAPDVSLDKLVVPQLTGGQIKNVVLNAARQALVRGPDASVTSSDFEFAIAMETRPKEPGNIVPIGFTPSSKCSKDCP